MKNLKRKEENMSDNVIRIMFYDEERGWVTDTIEASEDTEEKDSALSNESESSTRYARA